MDLNKMTKKEIRAQLAADAEAWRKEHGEPELYAAQSSPLEHFMLCGSMMKRNKPKLRDVKQEAYQEWLAEIKQRA